MSHDGDEVTVSFHPVPASEVWEKILSSAINNSQDNDKPSETSKRPKFGPQLDFNSTNFDFRKELEWLPFPVNVGEVKMTRAQQVRFLQLVYDNQSVFSLCDKDLDLCDCLKHTIPTTTDKPVYLPHHMIPVQLQAEVCKSLDAWLRQGIIRPSHSLYASQVVIVCKKSEEIRLCIDFRALNGIAVHDSFPYPGLRRHCKLLKVWCSLHPLILLKDTFS